MVKGSPQEPLTDEEIEEIVRIVGSDTMIMAGTAVAVFLTLSVLRSDVFPSMARTLGLAGAAVTTFASATWDFIWHGTMAVITVKMLAKHGYSKPCVSQCPEALVLTSEAGADWSPHMRILYSAHMIYHTYRALETIYYRERAIKILSHVAAALTIQACCTAEWHIVGLCAALLHDTVYSLTGFAITVDAMGFKAIGGICGIGALLLSVHQCLWRFPQVAMLVPLEWRAMCAGMALWAIADVACALTLLVGLSRWITRRSSSAFSSTVDAELTAKKVD